MPCHFCKTVLAKYLLVPREGLSGLILLSVLYGSCVLARKRWEYGDDAFFVFLDEFSVDTRSIVEAFKVRYRDQLDEILVADIVLCE